MKYSTANTLALFKRRHPKNQNIIHTTVDIKRDSPHLKISENIIIYL